MNVNQSDNLTHGQPIFFLKLQKDLPANYFRLAEMFLLYGHTLVPVEHYDLLELLDSRKQYVIALSSTIEERKIVKRIQKKFLEYSLIHNAINFYDISSFSKLEMNNIGILRTNYLFLALPLSLEELTEKVSKQVEKEMKKVLSWPGGRRPRLPKLVQPS